MRFIAKAPAVLLASLTSFLFLMALPHTTEARHSASPASELPVDYELPPGSMSFWLGDTGDTGPLYTGPQQYPFICQTSESGLGQPLVDNQDGIGNAVYAIEGNPGSGVVGYSANCSIATRVDYFYFGDRDRFWRFDPATGFDNPPADMRYVAVDGVARPFVVRVEAGTLNRFIYTIAMLAPFPESTATPATLDNSAWNGKLVYWLRGGVGIGHRQGEAAWHSTGDEAELWSAERQLFPDLLAQGYAVATSSGNETGVHYNLRIAEETALMVKRHFIDTYGEPVYTVGIGGSGGAIQQYVFAQNNNNILDGGIPTHSYPDMITQAIYVGDCNLLEQYFLEEVMLDPHSMWATWSNRRLIEGLNASDTVENDLTGEPGSTECIEGWFFGAPGVINPVFTDPGYIEALQFYGYPPEVIAAIKWTHWNDLENIYGTDEDGFAPIPFDNVGVQYGLQALVDGDITPQEFLKINACVGSWKEQRDYVNWNPGTDPFDSRNMKRTADCRTNPENPAARRHGDLGAMRAAYESGHVFSGKRLTIPVIDLRPYLEPELDMHNSRQSFSVRARLEAHGKGRGHKGGHGHVPRVGAANQVIWFAGSEAAFGGELFRALGVLDEHLTTGQRPAAFTDRCVAADGSLIAEGRGVWNGILERKPPGACARAFEIYSSSRMVAGDDFRGDMFKCELTPVKRALHDGTYGRNAPFTPAQVAWLHNIFPEGVCDYRRRDAGAPRGRSGH